MTHDDTAALTIACRESLLTGVASCFDCNAILYFYDSNATVRGVNPASIPCEDFVKMPHRVQCRALPAGAGRDAIQRRGHNPAQCLPTRSGGFSDKIALLPAKLD
jgi:hypothetical protein